MKNIKMFSCMAVAIFVSTFLLSACNSPMERDAKRLAKRAVEFQEKQRHFGDRSNLHGKPMSREEMEAYTRDYMEFVNNIQSKYNESPEMFDEFKEMVNEEIKQLNGDVKSDFSSRTLGSATERNNRLSTQKSQSRNTSGFVDLGLPSGTLWKNINENGLYDFDEAKSRFGNSMPSKRQMDELINKCSWQIKNNGFKVTGPNGNSIFLPNNGFIDCEGLYSNDDGIQIWSSSLDEDFWAWCLSCNSDVINVTNEGRCCKFAVRLVKNA